MSIITIRAKYQQDKRKMSVIFEGELQKRYVCQFPADTQAILVYNEIKVSVLIAIEITPAAFNSCRR
jgi:hypothetical protein